MRNLKKRLSRGWPAFALAAGLATAPESATASQCDKTEPGWLMCEDFEGGGAGWGAWYDQSQWTECDGCPGGANDPDRIRLEEDEALAHDGAWSLTMPGTSANNTGGTLRFATCADGAQQSGCALEGYDRLYFRTWTRLAAEHDYVHHFLGIRGSKPDGYFDANGVAGCRPNGDRWAGTRVDLNENHELFFYTYHPDMQCDSGGYCSGDYAQSICDGCAGLGMACANGPECCWGKHFSPETPVVLPTEEWTCIEMMMEVNTLGQSDGSMAFWVNDELAHEVTDMRWRDVPELQLNRAMLEHFIDSDDTDHPNQAWFDDVVVSQDPIGCGPGGAPEGGDDTGSSGPGAGSDSGGDDTAASDTQPGSDTGSSTTTGGGSASESGTEGSNPSTGASSASQTGNTDPFPGGDTGTTGCGCRSDRGRVTGMGWALLLLASLTRRRRRRAA